MQAARPSAIRARAAVFGQELKEAYETGKGEEPTPADDDATVDDVTEAMRAVDWAKVRSATAGRTAEASQGVRAMAQQVDWARVQPVAAQVSSALIAAVASGQIPLGGALGARVVRTIMNDRNLAARVGTTLGTGGARSMPPDFGPLVQGVIDTTAHDQ